MVNVKNVSSIVRTGLGLTLDCQTPDCAEVALVSSPVTLLMKLCLTELWNESLFIHLVTERDLFSPTFLESPFRWWGKRHNNN